MDMRSWGSMIKKKEKRKKKASVHVFITFRFPLFFGFIMSSVRQTQDSNRFRLLFFSFVRHPPHLKSSSQSLTPVVLTISLQTPEPGIMHIIIVSVPRPLPAENVNENHVESDALEPQSHLESSSRHIFTSNPLNSTPAYPPPRSRSREPNKPSCPG